MIKQAIIDSLTQGIEVLESLSQEDYVTKQSLVYDGCIGGHYRHLLEHYSMLLENFPQGCVNYDLRSRNTDIESCRQTALDSTRQIMERWTALDESTFDKPLKTFGKISHKSDESMEVISSVGREAAYSIAHAQHHFAIIGVMCNLLDHETCKHFGMAPSTAKYNAEQNAQTTATA